MRDSTAEIIVTVNHRRHSAIMDVDSHWWSKKYIRFRQRNIFYDRDTANVNYAFLTLVERAENTMPCSDEGEISGSGSYATPTAAVGGAEHRVVRR